MLSARSATLLGLAIIGAVAAGSFVSANRVSQGTTGQSIQSAPLPPHDPAVLKKEMGFELTSPYGTPAIDRNRAIALAVEQANVHGKGAVVQQASEIRVDYFLMTGPQLSNGQREFGVANKPVWIVSFEGLTIHPKGMKPGGRVIPDNREYNVIIDATTGQAIGGFTYR